MPSKLHPGDESAVAGEPAQAITLTVRKCDTESSLYRYVLSPDPDGEAEFVSPRYFLTGRDAFRAGSVHIRDCHLKNASQSGSNEQCRCGGPTYGEVMELLASNALASFRR